MNSPLCFSGILQVGEQFATVDDVVHTMKGFMDATFNQYIIKKSGRLTSRISQFPTGIASRAPPHLKYYNLKYTCIKEGTHKSKAQQRKTKSIRQGCGSYVYFRLSPCGQKLVLARMDLTHNHMTSEMYYRNLPHQRLGFSDEVRKKYREALQHAPNKRQLLSKINEETNCRVTMRDLHNIRKNGKMSSDQSSSRSKKNKPAVAKRIEVKLDADHSSRPGISSSSSESETESESRPALEHRLQDGMNGSGRDHSIKISGRTLMVKIIDHTRN